MRRAMLQNIGGVNFFVCDLVAGFTHAYSQARKLTSAYAGNILQVRRSSDNATLDIGDVSNELDEASLTSFVGVNNGFENILYDQIGSRDVIQITQANQPQIVSSGTVVKSSGKPYAQYNGTTTNLRTSTSMTPITDDNCTVFVVYESQSALSSEVLFQEYRLSSSDRVFISSDTRSTIFVCGNYAPDNTTRTFNFASQQPTSTKRVLIMKRNGNDTDIYDDTNTLIDTVNSSAVFSGNTILQLGMSLTGSAFFSGKIAELLINNTALSSGDQLLVLNNIKAYYGI